ncbi:MAG: hypothetical protein WCT12_32020, partial [Verrucomicrobiota bacterium]
AFAQAGNDLLYQLAFFHFEIPSETWCHERKAAHRKGLRDKAVRNRAQLAVKRVVQGIVQQDGPKAPHGELSRNRPIRFEQVGRE